MSTERLEKITSIQNMLGEMSDEQVDNVHVYTVDEYKEANHEAVALDAIIQLSRKYRPSVEKREQEEEANG